MIALGDLVSRVIIVILRSSFFHSSDGHKKTAESWLVRAAIKLLLPYVTHVINFTRLPHFSSSACNIEKLREPGDEATLHGGLHCSFSSAATMVE